jgi:heavy metal sensor kinase
VRLPVRARITAWYVTLLAVVIAAVGVFLAVRLRADLTQGIDLSLRPAAAQIAADYRKEGVPEFADSAGTVLKGERAAAQLLAPDGTVLASYGDPVAASPMLGPGAAATMTRTLGGQAFRLTAQRVVRNGEPRIVVAAQSLAVVERAVRRVIVLLLIAGPAALAAIALGGWWLARRALVPVERMTASAERIGVDQLGERVAVPRAQDELAHLARTLNGMLARIEGGVAEQRRLIADTSHELRTPLAAMLAELDVSLREDDLSPSARAVLLSVREEAERLGRTVDDLLTLAAGDDGRLVARPEPADLADVAARVQAALRPLAERRRVRVERRGDPAGVLADAELLAHALRNVVENAIKFGPEGGTVIVTTETGDGWSRVVVEDEGPGVPPELRERVFDRFFRADASRTRATGGSGLGLAIARDIVAAHDGRVWIRDDGAFVVELPAAGYRGRVARSPANAVR